MKLFGALILCLIFATGISQNNNKDFTQYVNPFIGSAPKDSNSLSGSVFPGGCEWLFKYWLYYYPWKWGF